MRALAHPVRIALLETLGREGPLTATKAAELLGDSPGNMSWHLQTLAKYGYVEEAGGGRGRSRPWRVAARSHSFEVKAEGPDSAAAEYALESMFHERSSQRLREWWAERRSYPLKWRRAAFSTHSITYLTAAELKTVSADIEAIVSRYRDRRDRANRPADALPVHLVTYGHPVLPTPSGN
jgi:DNA-binding transcriptional ArsR family regulator